MTCLEIKQNLIKTIKKAEPNIPANFNFEFEIPPEPKMGDLSFACFELAKIFKKEPADLAALLAKKIEPGLLVIKAKNIGPYLNFFLNKKLWFEIVIGEILEKKENFGLTNYGQGKTVLIEYSAPNTNKPLHLGHLRNTFLGASVANLLASLGFKVVRANLINDRGIHITKSMLAYQKWGEGKTPESEKIKGDHFVGKYYVLFEQKAKENQTLIDEAQALLRKWESGDSETIALWQKMNQWAMNGFKETYKKIGVDFDKWYFESYIYQLGKEVVLKALKKHLCYKRQDGAIEIDLDKYGLGKKVLLRPDGTSVYITQDIGLAKLKYHDFKPVKSIYVVAAEQDLHFKILFKILELFGFPWAKNCYHLSYGLIFLPEGKMKSREGTVVDADDIIAQMESLAKSEILARNPNLPPIEVSERARLIGLAALKFHLLKFTPLQTINFDPNKSISFEGATGPYLQYTYARIQSIIKKFQESLLNQDSAQPENSTVVDYSTLKTTEEINLLKKLFFYQNIILKAGFSYNPACLANYLLELTQLFNTFYHQHQVIRAGEQSLALARLKLSQAVAQVIKNGLEILGIKVLEEM
jgi:arginyl-tRNA synthetase